MIQDTGGVNTNVVGVRWSTLSYLTITAEFALVVVRQSRLSYVLTTSTAEVVLTARDSEHLVSTNGS